MLSFMSQNSLRGAGSTDDWMPAAAPSRASSSARSGVGSRRKVGSAVSENFWLPAATPGKSRVRTSKACSSKSMVQRSVEETVDIDEDEFLEPFVWTCGICQLELTARSKPALSKQRAQHVALRRKGRHQEAGESRERVDLVAASSTIPVAERAWSCAYCDAGLLHMSKYALTLSRQAHVAKVHKRKLSGAQIAKKMWAKWKKDPDSVPSLKAGRISRTGKMKEKYMKKRDLTRCGHELVPVDVDWSVWPNLKKASRKLMVGLTCKNCWIVCRGSYKGKAQCRGKDAPLLVRQVGTWSKICGTVNLPRLLHAWGVTKQQAEQRFLAADESRRDSRLHLKGHDWKQLCFTYDKFYPGSENKKRQKSVAIFTCPRCRLFVKNFELVGECCGLDRKISVASIQKWEALKASCGVRRELAAVWHLSVAEATQWFRSNAQGWQKDLTADGDVHPHPGPSLDIISINCGGFASVWRAVEEFLVTSSVDVLGIQEVCASDSELRSLQRSTLKHGYRMFHATGSLGRGGRKRGGVALFVRTCFRVQPAMSFSGTDSQGVGAWIDGWFVGCLYACPGHNNEPTLEALDHLVPWLSQLPLTQPWVVFGDLNEIPSRSMLLDALVGYGGFSVAPKVPTRWDGTRCVDWAICNRPDACENPKLLDVHLSDHIPVCFHIHGLGHALQLGSLARTCTMACPPGVDRSLWERAVSQEWNQNERVQQFLSQLATDAVVSVQ